MLIALDDSGCPGFKKASSPYLILAMVIFDHCGNAEECSRAIEKFKRDHKLYPELHFTKDSNKTRDAVFEILQKQQFSVRSLYIEKARIESHFLRSKPRHFYDFSIKQLVDHDDGRILNATLKIDGNRKERNKAFISYLREGASKEKFKKIKMIDSHKDNLVQVADYVASSLARPYNSSQRKHPTKWRDMIADKIENEWFFK